MWKIFIVFILIPIHQAQSAETAVIGNGNQNKVNLTRPPAITNSPDYLKVKGATAKIASDVDIDDVVAQKLISSYKISNIKNIFAEDKLINLSLLITRLLIITIIFSILWKAINRFTTRFVSSILKRTNRHGKYADAEALTNTAGPILNSILHWILICISILIVLAEIGVDIMPIIYGFGVFGLAISIGAQTLVRDIISGILTLFEGIVSVGEIVELNGQVGTIEAMSLRAIDFRHSSGKMQVVAFSEISSLLNLSRDYSVCSITLPVAHDADLSKVETMFKDVIESIQSDEKWKDLIIGEISFSGVVSITETAVYASCILKTQPDPYDLIGKEFRKRLHIQMQERKIPSPKFTSVMMKG